MDARTMAITQLDAKLHSLMLAGHAMTHHLVITPDEVPFVPTPDDDESMQTGEEYARDLVVEVGGNDEGLQLMFTLGGPFVCAQHIADLDVWYLMGRSATYRRTKTLDPTEHADAIRALDYLLDLHKASMPSIG